MDNISYGYMLAGWRIRKPEEYISWLQDSGRRTCKPGEYIS